MRIRIIDMVILGLIALLIGWNVHSLFRISQFVQASEIEHAQTSKYATIDQLNSNFTSLTAAINNLSKRTTDAINEVSQKTKQDYLDYNQELGKIYAILQQQNDALLTLRFNLENKKK
jgi:hypothetical protein